ncbi:MAG TPA: hypothetical protein VGF64_08710 [Acidimicrobiales bacterium]
MSLIRRLVPPWAATAVGIGMVWVGAPPAAAPFVAPLAGVLVDETLPTRPSREEIARDEENRPIRAQAYRDFGTSVAVTWQSAGLMLTFRPTPVGYLHGLAMLARAQRRFEEQHAVVTAALGHILLYGSSETQQAAAAVARTLGEQLTEVGRAGKVGSPDILRAYDQASTNLGNKVVAWRQSAQADLGISVAPPLNPERPQR